HGLRGNRATAACVLYPESKASVLLTNYAENCRTEEPRSTGLRDRPIEQLFGLPVQRRGHPACHAKLLRRLAQYLPSRPRLFVDDDSFYPVTGKSLSCRKTGRPRTDDGHLERAVARLLAKFSVQSRLPDFQRP